jgi:hypothetical protein
MRIDKNQPAHDTPAADEAEAKHGADEATESKGGKSAASASDPTGLGWRAKMAGQAGGAAATDEKKGGGLSMKALQDGVQKTFEDASGDPKHASLASVPDAVKAKVAFYQGENDKQGQGDKAFAWSTKIQGQEVYVAQEANSGPFMLTIYDKSGKELTGGEVNSDEDLGINW